MTEFARYARLWYSLAKFSLLGEMAFRGNFLIKVFVELLWLFLLLLFNFTVFQQTTTIADWDINEYLFFIGVYFALGGLLEALFLDNCNQFADLIRSGDLDFFLLKPIDEQFLISCKHVDWSCMPNVLLGFAVMGYALWAGAWEFDVMQIGAFTLLFISGIALAYGFLVMLMSASVWLMRNQSLYEMWWLFSTLMRYPREIFNGPWACADRVLLLFRRPHHDGDERARTHDGKGTGAVDRVLCGGGIRRGDGGEPRAISLGDAALSQCEQLTDSLSESPGTAVPGLCRSLGPDAKQMLLAANIQAPICHRWRREDAFAEAVFRKQVVLRRRVDHVNVALLAGGVHPAVDQQRRRIKLGVRQAFEPNLLAGLGLETAGNAEIVDEVDMFAFDDRARHIGKLLAVGPDAFGVSVFTSALQLDRDRQPFAAAIARHGQQHAIGMDRRGDGSQRILGKRPRPVPIRLAGQRLVAGDRRGAGHDQLRMLPCFSRINGTE